MPDQLMQLLQGLGLPPEAIQQALQMAQQQQPPMPQGGGELPLTPDQGVLGEPGPAPPMPISQANPMEMAAPPLPELPPEPQYEQLPDAPSMAASPTEYEKEPLNLGQIGRVLTRFGAAMAQPTQWGGGLGASLARGANAATDAMEQLYSVRAQHQRQQIEDAYRRAQLARERNREKREGYRDKVDVAHSRYKMKAEADRGVRQDILEGTRTQAQIDHWKALERQGAADTADRRQLRALGLVQGPDGSTGFFGSDGQYHPLPPGTKALGGFGAGDQSGGRDAAISVEQAQTIIAGSQGLSTEAASQIMSQAQAGTLTQSLLADIMKAQAKIGPEERGKGKIYERAAEAMGRPEEPGLLQRGLNALTGKSPAPAATPAPASPGGPVPGKLPPAGVMPPYRGPAAPAPSAVPRAAATPAPGAETAEQASNQAPSSDPKDVRAKFLTEKWFEEHPQETRSPEAVFSAIRKKLR